jgi:FMN-dependent NADH-azoreductase
MAKILHIVGSPRDDSFSTLAAEAFIAAHLDKNPDDTVERLDVWTANLPAFDAATLGARFAAASGVTQTPEQAKAWGAILKVVAHFKAFDRYVLSTPLWNFGIPYPLKHFVDVLAQPGQTFSFSPATGYAGLVLDKPITLFVASAGDYRPGAPAAGLDFATPYLEWIFKFIGFTDITSVRVGPTAGAPDVVEKNKQAAIAEARALVA